MLLAEQVKKGNFPGLYLLNMMIDSYAAYADDRSACGCVEV
jgi:hypothetical protein